MNNGLCDSCKHQKVISNTRGSTFSMCLLSLVDKEFAKYPRVPVLQCGGYQRTVTPRGR